MTHLRTGLAATFAAGAMAVALGAAPAAAQSYSFRLATIDVETGNYFSNIAAPFAQLVSELTQGDVAIQPLPAGTVGNIFKLHEAMEDGLVDMVNWPATFFGNADPFNAMINLFPTGLGSDSILAWTYLGGGEEMLREHRAETLGVHAMVLGSGPAEWFAHSHVPVETAADLKDLKYRTLGNWAGIVADEFGAAPTTTPGSEIYSMLERKGLDLAEYSMPGENWRQGLHETAEYIIYPGVHAPAWTFELMIDMDKWNSLPDRHKRAIEVAARLVTYESMQKTIMADIDAVKKVNERVGNGQNKLTELSPEFRAEMKAAARRWAARVSEEAAAAGNPWPKRAFESIVAFQDDWAASTYYLVTDKP